MHHMILLNCSSAISGAVSLDLPRTTQNIPPIQSPQRTLTLKNMQKRWRADCRKIAKASTLSCLAILLERGTKEVQYRSATVVMRITEYAEDSQDLRRRAFKPNSPAYKALIDQLLRVIDHEEDSELLTTCIRAIGCLSRTFMANQMRIINPLVKLLHGRKDEVSEEACLALTKFAHKWNFLCEVHAKAIVVAGGMQHLVQNVYFGAKMLLQSRALVLLCCVALSVPESEEFAQNEVLKVIEWALRQDLDLYQQQDASSDDTRLLKDFFFMRYTRYDDLLSLLLEEAKLSVLRRIVCTCCWFIQGNKVLKGFELVINSSFHMPQRHDDWERLVNATLDREHLRKLVSHR